MKRSITVLAAVVLVLSAVTPAAAFAGGSAAPAPTVDQQPTETVLTAQEDNETNGTESTSGESENAPPPTASQVRINPVSLDADYQTVTVAEEDATFNTTGEFVLFTTSERVDAARIVQSKAQARVLDGGQTVKVEYDDDAAPPGEQSLYTLQLFFADNSTKEVTLYAQDTKQSVAAASLEEWRGVINLAQDLAEAAGYDTDPEAVEEYLLWVDDRADLVDGFLTELAARTIGWLMAGVMNPLNIIIMLTLAAVAMWRRRSKHGELADALSSMAGRYTQKLDRLEIDRHRAKRTADDEHLSEVPAIGNYADYYEDAFGVKSPAQLAHLVATGEARYTQDGLEQIHNGVDDLDVEDLHGTWLEPALRHIPREKQVLNHLLETVKWMETEHQLGSLYRDTRNELETMLDDLERQEMQLSGTLPAAGDD